MTAIVNTNIMSLNAQRNLSKSQNAMATAVQRLSSGMRINSAKDDAAGLAIAERMTSQVRGLNQAVRNANDGISLAQVAEGSLNEITNNLQRIRELSVQSANATNSASDRAALQAEVAQLTAEIDRVATTANFNGVKLLNGTFTSQTFQVGADAGQVITVDGVTSARTSALGVVNKATTGEVTGLAAATHANIAATVNGQAFAVTGGDVRSLASAINAADFGAQPAVTATVGETTVTGGTTAAVAATGTLTLNGVSIGFTALTTNAGSNRTDLAAAINLQSAATGVSATDDGTGVTLTAADGRNVTVATTGTNFDIDDLGLGDGGGTNLAFQGNITLESSGVLTISGASGVGAAFASAAVAASGQAIADVNISTVGGANTALASVDAALATINSSRADLGAIQNRFMSVVANLESTAENVTAARSRIQDADFAAETANLTRGQILQQAGTAMIAQANSLPQSVLSLLG